MRTGLLDFALARTSARLGALSPDEVCWRRIATARDIAGVLEVVRASPLRHWTRDFAPTMGVHAAESLLRRNWRREVGAVAQWMPAPWHDAVRWLGTAVFLPSLRHLAAGGAPPTWMLADPATAALAGVAAPDDDITADELRALRQVGSDAPALAAAWTRAWRRHVPRAATSQDDVLAFAALLRRLLAPCTTVELRALRPRFVGLYRRAMLTPVAALAYLAALLLDVERLRGELVHRIAFADVVDRLAA